MTNVNPINSIAHTTPLFKTVCWPAGRVSSPAHVDNHEPRNGAPRWGLGGPSARASPGHAILRAGRPAPRAGDAASAHSAPRTRCVRRARHVCHARAAHLPARPRSVAPRAAGTPDEQFDVDRFGEWLEVLVDTGDSVAARTVAALDKHLVIVGLSRYLRVFDPGTFEPTESSDDEPMDRHDKMNSETSGDVLECEVGGYLVRARRTDAWDAIVTLLVTLETEHNHYFHAVMQGCRRLSNSRPEIDGLDDLLMAPEQHLHDVAIERERRRSRHGYATPADARAFLQMARQPHTRAPTARSRSTPSPRPTFARPKKKRTPHQKTRLQVRLKCATRLRARRRRHPHIDRRGHRTAGRGWRDAGTAAGAARSRRRGPSSRETPAPEAADGVRAAPRRDRVPHAQS